MPAGKWGDGYDTGRDFEQKMKSLLDTIQSEYDAAIKGEQKLQQLKLNNLQQYHNERMAWFKKQEAQEKSLNEKKNKLNMQAAEKYYKQEEALRKKYVPDGKWGKDWKKHLTEVQKQELANLQEKFLKQKQYNEELAKLQQKAQDIADRRAERSRNVASAYDGMFGSGKSFTERIAALKTSLNNGSWLSAIGNLTKALDDTIDSIAGLKTKVDTRLYGLNGRTNHWDSMSKNISGAIGISPYIKQETMIENLTRLIGEGIAFNVEQRAFLATVSESVATTFNAFNSNLYQLIRVQQADSTAARLGMEASLTAYLNNMYQNTEYLDSISKTVSANLYEASSLMSATNTIGFEYQAQKWLGSLYSVGMSEGAVGKISSALGALASGDLSQTGSGVGNLLVMAANRAGLSYSDLLTGGLNETTTNQLMYSLVDYIGSSLSSGNKVVQSQLAKVFGLSTSDIQAVKNLSGSLGGIYNNYLNYGGAMNTLTSMVGSIGSRMSLGGMMSNVWGNAKYGLSANIANNPALYAMYKASGLLDTVAGGGNLPSIHFAGTGIELNTTIADLMRFGALGGGILSMIGQMIGAGSAGGTNGLLNAFGINSNSIAVTSRGNGLVSASGATTSQSTFVGNASGSDVMSATYASADEQADSKMAEAVADEDSATLDTVQDHIVEIETILHNIANGDSVLRVKVANWGLFGGNSLGDND